MRYSRQAPEDRQDDLIDATLEVIGREGIDRATVRAIALCAGVTPGLIRHHFVSKDDLLAAAFERHMTRMLAAADVRSRTGSTASGKLAAFIEGSLKPPSVGTNSVALWAGFLSLLHSAPKVRETHARTYRAFRDRLQTLIETARAEAGLPISEADAVRMAIAANAVIDGLWLEGSVLPGEMAGQDIVRLGYASLGALCGLELEPVS